MLTLPYVTSATSESNFDVLIWGLESNILLSDPQNRMANVKDYLFYYRYLAFENIQGLQTVEAENGGCQFTPFPEAALTSNFQKIKLA